MIITQQHGSAGAAIGIGDYCAEALVDRDWLHHEWNGPISGFALGADGSLWWGADRLSGVGEDPFEHAGSLMLAYVDRVIEAIGGVNPSRVRVTGHGLLATEVRRRVGQGHAAADARPLVVVEMTGEAHEVIAATALVQSGGLVLLAGESPEPIDINLYKDIHKRGLTVRGVPGPASCDPQRSGALPAPSMVHAGGSLPQGSWFRVTRAH